MHLVVLVLTALSTSSLFAVGFSDFDMDGFNRRLLGEKKELSGNWHSSKTWEGFFCQGRYHYRTGLKGKLDDLKMEVVGEKKADIHAEFTDVNGSVFGSYRTSKLLCYPFQIGLDFLIDRVSVYARADLIEEGAVSKIKIKVISTHFGTVHLGESVSPTIERFLTRIVNTAFRWIWDSRFGAWISERLTDEVNKEKE